MVTFLTLILPLIFTNNLVMSLVKYASDHAFTSAGLRFILGAMSISGVIAGSALTGDPINFDSITGLLNLTIEAAMVAFGAHFTYKAIKV